jgi:DNA-binding MarR family transcriptional regulator
MLTDHNPSRLIRKVQLLLRRMCDAELQQCGLSFSQYAVLQAIADHQGASLTGLARCCGISKQAVHQVLRGLRAASLVAVESSPDRAQPVELTAEGVLQLVTATDAVNRAAERMLAGIAPRNRNQLAALLRRCAENLEAQ